MGPIRCLRGWIDQEGNLGNIYIQPLAWSWERSGDPFDSKRFYGLEITPAEKWPDLSALTNKASPYCLFYSYFAIVVILDEILWDAFDLW